MLNRDKFDEAFNQLCAYCRVGYRDSNAWREEFWETFQYMTPFEFKETVHQWIKLHKDDRRFPSPWDLKHLTEPKYVSSSCCDICKSSGIPGVAYTETLSGKWLAFRCTCNAGEMLKSTSETWKDVLSIEDYNKWLDSVQDVPF